MRYTVVLDSANHHAKNGKPQLVERAHKKARWSENDVSNWT